MAGCLWRIVLAAGDLRQAISSGIPDEQSADAVRRDTPYAPDSRGVRKLIPWQKSRTCALR
ncbi:hypothetical protein [Bifidobacterium porcinum]|uniref:hypothetical protein n=1 Tax=Bifidobacterium porcinum TaxID=212365 RepID=UPI0019553FD2|nr:hypothetical protein [Bifidobacterium porcinum]